MYYVIGNVYKGEGFTWIENGENLPNDLWKYSRHGEFEDENEALAFSELCNERFA